MIGLAYLLWAPLGAQPLRDFLRSYHAHRAGVQHELIVIFNGLHAERDHALRHELLAELAGTPHRALWLPAPVLDLHAYGVAARELAHARLCLLNSYSVILADSWLAHLSGALDQPRVGLAGATGSWESQAEWVRGRAPHWPYQLLGLRRARRDYPRFPNPHVRTTGFAMRRAELLELQLHRATDKRATYLLESGHHSITRRVLDGGRRAVLVGRDGRLYDVQEWPRSATFRSGRQANLLIADNRTEEWLRAPARVRARLSRDAWGQRAHSGAPRAEDQRSRQEA